MKKTNLFRKTVSIAAAAAALVTAFTLPVPKTATAADDVTETAEEEKTYPTHLQNGSFEYPKVDTAIDNADMNTPNYSGTTYGTYTSQTSRNKYQISNYDNNDTDIIFKWHRGLGESTGSHKEPWFTTTKVVYDDIVKDQYDESADYPDSFYWETTAADDRIELAVNRNKETWYTYDNQNRRVKTSTVQYFDNSTNEAGDGSQFAELVATERSSLYQTISTEPGNILTWKIKHRGRTASNADQATDYVNSMAVFIGPKQGGLKKANDDYLTNDLFGTMVAFLQREGKIGTLNSGTCTDPIEVYSSYVNNNGTTSEIEVSLTPTETCNQKWTCWIIASNDQKWYDYSGEYTVPEEQTETTFAFAALNSANDGNTEGNCLDGIEFGIKYPLAVSTNQYGGGEVSGDVNGTVKYNNSFTGSANEGSTVTITARPETGCTFVGARVNNEPVGIGKDGFESQDNGTYTYTLTMNEAYTVDLIFGPVGKVIYDLNGGTWDEKIETEHELETLESFKQTNVPTMSGNSFLRWEVYAANGTTSLNGTAGERHTVTYNADTTGAAEHSFTITTDSAEEEESQTFYIPKDAGSYAIVLRAVYQHTVTVKACTQYFDSTMEDDVWEDVDHNDPTGGTVTVKNLTHTDASETDNSVTVDPMDKFEITATANDGFEIVGWHYEYIDNNSNSIHNELPSSSNQEEYSAEFKGSRDVTIHVHFREIPITPYLSAVAESSETDLSEITVGHGNVAHKDDVKNPVYNNGTYGGDLYGNTISTGFFATRSFGDAEKISGTWTIDIPANGTYIKTGNPSDGNIIGDAVVEDSLKVQYNRGSIYKASDSIDRQVKFYVSGTTVVSNTDVVFGIVIDNLYAPNAQAGFIAGKNTAGENNVLNGNNSVTADKDKGYDPAALDKLSGAGATSID